MAAAEMPAILERLRASVPANVREVCAQLARNGHQAVAVGGAVRDAILGRAPGDWDVATSAYPDAVLALFRHCIPTGLQHGTVTIVTGRGEASHVEVTTFRGEGEYTDARRPDRVEFGVPLERDLARRDLRVNAMAYDPAAHALIDPFGGRRDIAERVLRAVGPTGDVYADAVARFTEDGLRVMRAVRFAAQLEFALDADTARGITPALPSLAKVSRERVSDELRKILDAREPSRALGPARATGILRTVAPALDAAITDEAAWLGAIDRAPAHARLAAMFAPLAGVAERELEALLRALKLTVDEVRTVVAIATRFTRATTTTTAPAARAVLAAIGRPVAPIAVEVWTAWQLPAASLGTAVLADPIAVGELAIAGKDLLDAGIPPGPRIGTILRDLLARVLDDPALNTRERLLSLALPKPDA